MNRIGKRHDQLRGVTHGHPTSRTPHNRHRVTKITTTVKWNNVFQLTLILQFGSGGSRNSAMSTVHEQLTKQLSRSGWKSKSEWLLALSARARVQLKQMQCSTS
jgi:hypothetical protein